MALEAVVSVVADKLLNFIIEEVTSLRHVKDKLEFIETELRYMQQFLQDADNKQHDHPNVKNWVNEVRKVAFHAEDVVETYILKRTLQQRRNFVCRFAFKLNDLYASRKFCKEVERIQNSIREISNRRSNFHIEAIGGGSEEASSSASEKLRKWRRSVAYKYDENQVVGLENDVNTLTARLIGEPSRRCVISIVGMGGLGKSTLAKRVYNCNEAKSHFKCRVWVDVSQVFNAKDLLQEIVEKSMNLKKEDLQNMNEENLKEKINGFLTRRKYLVVMDDVWEKDLWNHLHTVFPDMNNGSRIIFTTRNNNIASHADHQSPFHELQPLSNSDSWELFIKKILSREENTLPKELEEVGKKIVEKCKGLPLAIVVLGGFLSRKRKDRGEWSKVLDRVSWQLNEDETPCSQILALSYNDLPSYLKSCFLYLGIFPEDYEISARNLMRLWISEGFVKPKGNEQAEDVAEDYLEELVDRCMVQVAARRPTGSIKKCRIHDLLRDLTISKAEEVELFHIHPNPNSSSTSSPPLNKVRRLSVHKFSEKHFGQCIRSAFYFFLSDHKNMYGAFRSIMDFGMLRVLHLNFHLNSSVVSSCLPKAVGKLIHLRYLRLRFVRVTKFPLIINKFRNLEFLDLQLFGFNCGRDAISKMDHLRHLKFAKWDKFLLDPPRGNDSSSIRNLQTLQGIRIDNTSVVKDGWDKYTNLRNLRLVGDLESQVEALSEWIAKLDRLESLDLDFKKSKNDEEKFKDPIERMSIFSRNNPFNINLFNLYLISVWIEKLPDPCEFPSNFSHLKLEHSRIGAEAIQTLGKLPKLKSLWISSSVLTVKAIMFSSGAFPQLQDLGFSHLEDLEEWKVEEGALPCLKELSIWDCKKLKALPDGLVHITTLLKFHVGRMREEFNARVKPNVGEDWGKIAHVPDFQTN